MLRWRGWIMTAFIYGFSEKRREPRIIPIPKNVRSEDFEAIAKKEGIKIWAYTESYATAVKELADQAAKLD
jgi:hypothetical protein